MALGSKNRDYKTEHLRTTVTLRVHKTRMEELMAEGLDRDEASATAFREIRRGDHRGWLRREYETLRDEFNGRTR